MVKDIKYGAEARSLMYNGVEKLANAVRVTLGPKGKNAVLAKKFGGPLITNDGVSIAKEITLKDPYEDMGAKLVYEVANKTNDVAGDGTTTATVLAEAMIADGLDAISDGFNPVLLRKGMTIASKKIAKYLSDELSHHLENDEDVQNVASISAGDDVIGEIIAKAISKVGRDGVISVDESRSFDDELEITDGVQYDKGYASPYFANDGDSVTMENPLILLTNNRINDIQELLPLLENFIQGATTAGRPLFIIADDFSDGALSALVVNKIRGTLNVVATKAPGFGDRRNEYLEDIATLTGATFINKDLNMDVHSVTVENLGSVDRVIVTKDSTTIVSNNRSDIVKTKIDSLKAKLEEAKNDPHYAKQDIDNIEKRIGRLTNGVATIRVGATTETELNDKKLRIEDALNATKAAIEDGIVIGGGAALAHAYVHFKGSLTDENDTIQKGIDIVLDSLLCPMKQIVENAGYYSDKLAKYQIAHTENNNGFDAMNGKWCDMFEAGIIDPTKVTVTALMNASSIAALFITSDVAVTELPNENENILKLDQGQPMGM